jgi:hypothetical protein
MRTAILGMLIVLVVGIPASSRVVSTKVIKADTSIVSIKLDTIRKVTYDTFYVNKTYIDTSLLTKLDTVKHAAAPKAKK